VVTRRDALKWMAAGGLAACHRTPTGEQIVVRPLGGPQWPTPDPFLFCVHHDDRYPAGNAVLGPRASLAGRDLGRDFAGPKGRDGGWRMYHGHAVPGFPQHPHRGFETVTVVRRGLLDHSDSLGATARYGGGDVQWLTAGHGILHAEMFPLVDAAANPVELFQIWLNLPRADKLAPPRFSMLWANAIPRYTALDDDGRSTEVTVIAGAIGDRTAPAPPPRSWAAQAHAEIAIWTIRMEPGARWSVPAASSGLERWLYVFRGGIGVHEIPVRIDHVAELSSDRPAPIVNGSEPSELLMLQGRPIGEPIVRRGPFVMTSEAEIRETIAEYQQTRFGGWRWGSDEPVHAADAGRFARHVDGHLERPG
jgi:quercetin 2,3-dioxygenase